MVGCMKETAPELISLESIPEHLRQSHGFVIRFPDDLKEYQNLYSDIPLKSVLKDFLSELLTYMVNGTEYCCYQDISNYLKGQNKAKGKSTIYSHCKDLTLAGVFDEKAFKPKEQSRRVKILTLNPPIVIATSLENKYREPLQQTVKDHNQSAIAEKKQELLRSQFGDHMLSVVADRSYRDMIMSAMMAKCIRLDAKDERKKIVTNFNYKDTPVDVTTTTLTEGNIAVSSDIRYTMVITTFCLQIMSEYLEKYDDIEKKPENIFVLDLSEVCDHIGNKRSTGNRLTSYRACKRLFQTNFEIKTPQDSEFAERFLEGYNEANYRFLTDFRAVLHQVEDTDDMFSEDEGIISEDISNPRYIRISLWPASFDSIWDQVVNRYQKSNQQPFINNFIQNPEVVRNKAPLSYHLYSHLSAWVGVKGNDRKSCNTSQLHEYMLKSSRYQNFVRSLVSLFQGLQPDGAKKITIDTKSFQVNFYGYIIEGRSLTESELQKMDKRKKGFHLTFYRDVEDKYIGDRSHYNKLIAASNNVNEEADNSSDSSSHERFTKLRDELGKSPDDIDIPPQKVIQMDGEGQAVLSDYELF